jgi:hypothetical protein
LRAEWRKSIGRTDHRPQDLGGEALRCPGLRLLGDDADVRSSAGPVEALQLFGKSLRLRRAIAAQAGWGDERVGSLLDTYGHKAQVPLAECDALYAEIEARERATDARPTHEAPDPAPGAGLY